MTTEKGNHRKEPKEDTTILVSIEPGITAWEPSPETFRGNCKKKEKHKINTNKPVI